MGLFVKICGLARREDVEAVAALRPDAMGFVFWPRSKRYVQAEQVAEWVGTIPDTIRKVGVFVDASPDEVERTLERAGLVVAQLHGDESPETVGAVRPPRWKAIHLDRMREDEITGYHVDAFLVDSYSAESPGGTGRVGDWNQARGFVQSQDTPVLLAGGLTPDNVREAIRAVEPWGVDVSSGVEAEPGKKDIDRVRLFIEQCRNT